MPQVGLRRCCRIAKSACLRMYPSSTLEDAQKPKFVGMTTCASPAAWEGGICVPTPISPSSIPSYIRQGKLKAFRVAGLCKVLIARAELLALLEPTISSNAQRSAA